MAALFPGWNSLDAVARWYRGFEIAGFVALGLLLLFEILAYIYSNRKDALMASMAREARIHQQAHDQQMASAVREANGAASKALEEEKEAEQKVGSLMATRSLSPEQREKLREILSTSPNHEIYVLNPRGNKECQDYADQFAEVLVKAGWKVLPPEFWMSTVQRDFKGFHIWVSTYDNPGCAFLQRALKDATGIYADGGIAPALATHDHKDACILYVGFK